MQKKIKTLLKAPLLVSAGYGQHARMIAEALLGDPLFEVYFEEMNWGGCSYVTHETPLLKTIKEGVQKLQMSVQQGQTHTFDLFIHLTVPQEFERKGKFNVGVTAGIETDRVSHVWVQKSNEMDLLIVPSEHAKKSFLDTVVQWRNQQTGETGELKLNKPIVVCPEGINTELFKSKPFENKIGLELDSDFNFLHVGQWGSQGLGKDRKNIALTIKVFLETFRNRKDVGLVLKTNMARNSNMDYDAVKFRLEDLKRAINIPESECPPIYLIHANLSEEEMADLYNHPKIKAFLTLTHGEGFGIPILEAAATGLPVLATNWSGHLDILKEGKFIPMEYELKEIPDEVVWDPLLIKGSRWANVVEDDAGRKMDKLVKSYSKPKEWANELALKVKHKFNLKTTNDVFLNTIKEHLLRGAMDQINPVEYLESFIDTPEDYNIIFTMPRSTGDVFISTAVLDGLMKDVPANTKVYYATDPKYFNLLKDNPHVHKCIPWNQSMMQIELLEEVFDLALTPDISTQYLFSNWIRKGQGRLLAEEYANHCHTELGDYYIAKDPTIFESLLKDVNYITFHPGSGKGQWAGRKYLDWPEVLQNLKTFSPNIKVVQVGMADEPLYSETDIDLRGKTSYQQLASVLENSSLHLGIDSFNMHLACALYVPTVAIFGCSTPTATGPWVKDKEKAKYYLLASERKSGCVNRPCYKDACAKSPENPSGPLNEIDPFEIFQACAKLLKQTQG